jgi:hypothetical protein
MEQFMMVKLMIVIILMDLGLYTIMISMCVILGTGKTIGFMGLVICLTTVYIKNLRI